MNISFFKKFDTKFNNVFIFHLSLKYYLITCSVLQYIRCPCSPPLPPSHTPSPTTTPTATLESTNSSAHSHSQTIHCSFLPPLSPAPLSSTHSHSHSLSLSRPVCTLPSDTLQWATLPVYDTFFPVSIPSGRNRYYYYDQCTQCCTSTDRSWYSLHRVHVVFSHFTNITIVTIIARVTM